jgi:hypothetical protein
MSTLFKETAFNVKYTYLYTGDLYSDIHHCILIILYLYISSAIYLRQLAIYAVQDDKTCNPLKVAKMRGRNMLQCFIRNVRIVKLVGSELCV